MTTREEFLQTIYNNFSDKKEIMQMVDIIDQNIFYVLDLHKENKEFLEELQNFPKKDLKEYKEFCDNFLRKKFGDIIGIDSIFIYTHPKQYITNLEQDFAIKIDDNIAELIQEMGTNLLRINIEPLIAKHSWTSKVGGKHHH